jgi:hypothetical protein
VVPLVLVAGAFLLTACSSATVHKQAASSTTSISPTTTTAAARPAALCPLTGTPVPGGGGVPQRPALAVKVDNYSAARPQSGLADADIVFEEPVEGGITRYVVVFQCQQASLVGPVRSARNIDIGILGEFGHPLLVHVGGINPVLANIEASPLVNVDLGNYPSANLHVPGRVAPYDTYASTATLWGLRPADVTPPAPVFSFSTTPPTGTPIGSIAIPFSSQADVVWNYSATQNQYLRSYGSTPDEISGAGQESATNVIVQFIQVTYGPWAENSSGALEVQANLYQAASGPAEVFRNGKEIVGTWSRSSLGSATQFTASNGTPITLQPGRTWVELVPNTVTVSTSPPTTGQA